MDDKEKQSEEIPLTVEALEKADKTYKGNNSRSTFEKILDFIFFWL